MAGLDPAIHLKSSSICAAMDCRVKPGNDELDVVYNSLAWPNARATRGTQLPQKKMPGFEAGHFVVDCVEPFV
ncbi:MULTISPECIES: hypothetical protein [unclassified Afipia]|uniref:hypothetical protein n=1 Tax=unclassified Afipia TaxID=2642050 RepID=UPI00178C204E|nr:MULTISPECIES: hypothetical protein [unclassified Afipia]